MSLPKASEVPLKPSYRVLIDGRETAKGFLFIPAFAAQPGWEQSGYFGGWIVLPTATAALESNWHIGNSITVYINENKVMGMESHSLTLPLKPIALKYKCDVLINGISLNWETHVLTVSMRFAGQLPKSRQVNISCNDSNNPYLVDPNDFFSFLEAVVLKASQPNYSISKKLRFPNNCNSLTVYVCAHVASQGNEDIDWRNNYWKQCKFAYPNSNPAH
jgi:hypothetical protein